MPRPHVAPSAPTDSARTPSEAPARRTTTTARTFAAAHQHRLLDRVHGLIRAERSARRRPR
jgi:hypothetical protein